MDIFNFIGSRDIRRYLKEIQYKFNGLECAWLIYQSETATLADRHAAWREIIDTMRDYMIKKYFPSVPQNSLHRFLKRYMEVENRIVQQFYELEKGSIFQYLWWDKDDYGHKENGLYPTMDDCFGELFAEHDISDIFCIDIIKKQHSYKPFQEYIHARLTSNCQIISITKNILSYEDNQIKNQSFKDMNFAFPTPFKQGDVLYDITRNAELNHNLMIFDKIDLGDNGKHWAYGYTMEQGLIIYEGCDYLNLEYYRNNCLKDEYRALEYMQKYLCGNLSITRLMNTYHQILCEEEAERTAMHCRVCEEDISDIAGK